MRRRKILFVLLFALAGIFLLIACGQEGQPVETVSPPELPQEIIVETPADTSQLAAGNENAYPPPETGATGGNQSPYPLPGEQAAGQVVQPPETQNPYPEPQATTPPVAAAPQTRSEPSRELVASDPTKVQLVSGKLQLVEFFAFWDGTSKAFAPIINSMASSYSDQLNFIFLDIDDPATQKFRQSLGYRTQPHFFLLDQKGNVIKQWQGNIDVADIHSTIEAALP